MNSTNQDDDDDDVLIVIGDTIDIALDDDYDGTLGSSGSISISGGGHSGYPSIGTGTVISNNGNGSNGVYSGGSGMAGNLNWPNTTFTIGSIGATLTAVPAVIKKDVEYIIVRNDGTTVYLNEQDTITPREMIGITKFLQIIQHGMAMHWSSLIKALNIERHFTPGQDFEDITESPDVLYFFLHDPE